MLRNRLLTAVLLAPLIILAILKLSQVWFAVLWGGIIMVAGWEWSYLAGLEKKSARVLFVGSVLLTLLLVVHYWKPITLSWWLLGPVVFWWFAWSFVVRRMPDKLISLRYPLAVKIVSGWFVLVTAWVFLVWLRLNFSPVQVLYLILLVWLADASAYFIGQRWGVTKLAPQISPGKTVEGLYGAFLITVIFSVSVGVYYHLESLPLADFVFLSVITVLLSVSGDLFESLAKRVRGVKDSGSVLPGHGGILDRIDSLAAAAPVFYTGSLLQGIFL
jgi:phosphatidate cytidylyltransferase